MTSLTGRIKVGMFDISGLVTFTIKFKQTTKSQKSRKGAKIKFKKSR